MYIKKHLGGALLLALVSVFTLSTLVPVQSASAADTQAENKGPYGYWKSVDKKTGKTQSIFKLSDEKGKLTGKIVKAFPKPGEKYNPVCSDCEGDRKGKPKIGMVFFWDFVPAKGKARKWVDGKILNPDDGKTYGSEAELSEDGTKLDVYGYIRILIKIGGTSTWLRPTAAELEGI
jgi:uncharacterized protein (DUF2147 family)